MAKHTTAIPESLHLISRPRHLERIADSATNIAEDVIYMVEGEIVATSRRSSPTNPGVRASCSAATWRLTSLPSASAPRDPTSGRL